MTVLLLSPPLYSSLAFWSDIPKSPTAGRARQRITALQLMQTCADLLVLKKLWKKQQKWRGTVSYKPTWPTLCAALQNVLYILLTSYNSLIFEQITICLYNRVEVVFSTTIPCFFGWERTPEVPTNILHTGKSEALTEKSLRCGLVSACS